MGACLTAQRLQGGSQTLSSLAPAPSVARVVRVVPDVSGINKVFDYSLPARFENVRVGSIVRVELHGRRVDAWVVEIDAGSTSLGERKLKDVIAVLSMGPPSDVVALATWTARRFSGPLRAVLKSASPQRRVRAIASGQSNPSRTPTPSQRLCDANSETLLANGKGGVLVWPPMRPTRPVIEAAIRRGPTLVVTPSVGFARTIAVALRREGVSVALLPDDWQRAAQGVDVVVGARSAVWAPAPHLTSIVVLDEHDERLQDERSPTWHARDVAIERARAAGIPCLLVSPFPTVVAVEWAGTTGVIVPERVPGDWPNVVAIDPFVNLADDEAPQFGMLSSELIADLRNHNLNVVCVVNTKGRSRLLACKSCHAISRCEECNAAVTQNESGELECPSCAARRPVVCQNCASNALVQLRKGVTRLREEVEAAAGRGVVDVTGETQVSARSKSCVYIGTEAVLHRVSSADVVVFLDFDNELFAPTYRAGEQAWNLVILASRLLRGSKAPKIILQTNDAGNPLVRQFVSINPIESIKEEMQKRKMLQLPPYSAMARVVVSESVDHKVLDGLGLGVMVAPLHKQSEFLIRAGTVESLTLALEELRRRDNGAIRCYVDPSRY